MTTSFISPTIIMRTGDEPIAGTDKTLLDFWRWGFSDVLSNTTRGIFAEYLVANALGIEARPRLTWDPFDLKYDGITIEVKSCAYIQSWQQRKPSRISFDVAETRLYNYDTGGYGGEAKRQAKTYIFCLLHHTDPETINPLDAAQWEFYVLPSAVLNEKLGKQKRMSLRTLIQLGGEKTAIETLRSKIKNVNP